MWVLAVIGFCVVSGCGRIGFEASPGASDDGESDGGATGAEVDGAAADIDAGPGLAGDTCATVIAVAPGESVAFDSCQASDDLTSGCLGSFDDLVFVVYATDPPEPISVVAGGHTLYRTDSCGDATCNPTTLSLVSTDTDHYFLVEPIFSCGQGSFQVGEGWP